MTTNEDDNRRTPRRFLSKQEAVRRMIHAAVRMLMAREDPFAIHFLLQAADKVLIDLSTKQGKELLFNWDRYIKPEYRKIFYERNRQTFNFFKHADRDSDQQLPVHNIGELNILQIGLLVVNYHAFFGVWTNHMQLIFTAAQAMFPECFVKDDVRPAFDAVMPKLENMTLEDIIVNDLWWDSRYSPHLKNLSAERAEDQRDVRELYSSPLHAFQK